MAEWTLEVVRIDGDKVIARVLDRQVDDGEYVDACFNYGPEPVPVPAREHWDVGSEVELDGFPVLARRATPGYAARAGQLVAEQEMEEWDKREEGAK